MRLFFRSPYSQTATYPNAKQVSLTTYRDADGQTSALKTPKASEVNVPGSPKNARHALIDAIPLASLHVHLGGTVSPELLFKVAERNKLLPLIGEAQKEYHSAGDLRKDYAFQGLNHFLKFYHLGTEAFRTEKDFYELTLDYLKSCKKQNIPYVEVFFDPQSYPHAPLEVQIEGFQRACKDAKKQLGITTRPILTFVRHDGFTPDKAVASAMALLDALEALDKKRPGTIKQFVAVGLGGIEDGYPPALFKPVYQRAKALGIPHATAHAGEVLDSEDIWNAINDLNLERIDHGQNAINEEKLLRHLAETKIPLTLCPISNLLLNNVTSLENHPLRPMLDRGLVVSVHDDDPALFDGKTVKDNLHAIAEAQDLSPKEIVQLARNSFLSAFMPDIQKQQYLADVDRLAKQFNASA